MNVVLPIRSRKRVSGTSHRIVAYDRNTDELVVAMPVPVFLDLLATKITEVPADDPDALFCYVLGQRQVDTFQFLLGLRSDLGRYEYFLEPAQSAESVAPADKAVEAKHDGNDQITGLLVSKSDRDEARSESIATFEELAVLSQAKNRKSSRITESELTVPTLRVLEDYRESWVTTSRLIGRLSELLKPSGTDAEILAGRHDTYFSQKVRNMISHRHNQSSFINRGLAEYESSIRSLRITKLGVRLISGLRT